MLVALIRLVILNIIGNLLILMTNVPRLLRLRRRPRWVLLVLKDPLPSRPQVRSFFSRRVVPSLAHLERALEELGKDPRLVGVVVDLDAPSGGWARLQTLHGLLAGFREKGKRVVVHLSAPSLRDYYVACAGESIFVDESGPLALTGLAASATFFAGALGKVGARAEAEYRGAYKSFAETFTRDDMSPAHHEAAELLLDRFMSDVTSVVATARKLEPALARGLVEGGPYTAAQALEKKIVDGVCYRDEVPARLAPGGPTPRVGSPAEWAAARLRPLRWRPLFPGRRVRVVALHGQIIPGEGTDYPRKMLGAEAVRRVLGAAREQRRVAAVVLHIDSRGGSAPASDIMWREVVRLAEKKPVIAYFDDYAASGGYYLACGATRIVAQPSTLTGSIGVVAGKLNLEGVYERMGLKKVTLRRGEVAAMNDFAHGYSPEERRRLAAEVDALYEQFCRKVAAGRKLSREAVEAAAGGRVWTGADARERGLVDELGGVDVAVRLARELARRRPGETLLVEDATAAPLRRNLLRFLAGQREAPALVADAYEALTLAGERTLFLADPVSLGGD